MRIGIDCDGVLRDFIGQLQDTIKKYHPELANQLKTPLSWGWEQWIPFWTDEETEKFVFEDHTEEIFYTADAYDEAIEDWPVLMEWAKNQGHELILVSAQRDDCIDITNMWLDNYRFKFDERIYTHLKHLVDVDVLVDDSPAKLGRFKKKSVNNGIPIVFRQTWNTKSQKSKLTIDRLSDLMYVCFGKQGWYGYCTIQGVNN